tara:strand:- start:310 stop:2037 length:1728 start_codon:yes stop_codon:yes gene_type:complete
MIVKFLKNLLMLVGIINLNIIPSNSELNINNNKVKFTVALKQRNTDELYNIASIVSDPSSNMYGKYWDIDEINNLLTYPKEFYQPTTEWLDSNNVEYTYYNDMIDCEADIKTVNSIFKIDIQKTKTSGIYHVNRDYTIPSNLIDIIDFVEGLSNNKYTKSVNYHVNNYKNPADGFVGREVINRLYNISDATIYNNNVSVCSVEYQDNPGFSQSDLLYQQNLNAEKNKSVNNNHIIGDNVMTDLESQLDMQMMSQTAQNVELWFWDEPLWLYSFASKFFNTKNVPDVISMSWGWSEADQCSITNCSKYDANQYIDRVNTEYAKLVLRGITITVSSGDAGSAGRTNEMCDSTQSKVNPVFPGSSPWVTSVSATFISNSNNNHTWHTPLCLENDCPTGLDEFPTNYNETDWTTGGGFAIFDSEVTPKWQSKQVNDYLKSDVPKPTNFNKNGRGYPDVSAIGHNCPVIDGGILQSVDGTSCSSPLFAAIVSLLNDYQVSRGKPKLGFINPVLYKMAEDNPNIFHDIKEGNNFCTEYFCCPIRKDGGSDFGYLASNGWDPVTGLGTPNVGLMKEWLDSNL